MSKCDCNWCDSNRHIGELRQTQKEGKCKKLVKVVRKNPTSAKILLDRYQAARKWLMLNIRWYVEAYTEPERYGSWKKQKIKRSTWGVKKYNEARVECKRRGLL